jgi:D-alanyl-D-alanine-carboxypeptidase/D-alanyl-D-alanine-endopeptidase
MKFRALSDREIAVAPGLAAAYAAAKAVWRAGDITAAPLANNVLMDRDRAEWARMLAGLTVTAGECGPRIRPGKPLTALSARQSR